MSFIIITLFKLTKPIMKILHCLFHVQMEHSVHVRKAMSYNCKAKNTTLSKQF